MHRAVFASGQVGLQIAGRLSVRPGQSEKVLGFSGQALKKLAGFMGHGGAGRLSVYSL